MIKGNWIICDKCENRHVDITHKSTLESGHTYECVCPKCGHKFTEKSKQRLF